VKIYFVRRLVSIAEYCRSGHLPIDTLSDDVLLCIFDSYRLNFYCSQEFVISNGWGSWLWHKFVHVCRRWRCIVFAFPVYLDLRLTCRSKTDVERALDIWPVLPLSIEGDLAYEHLDHIIDTLEHRDRMAEIHLGLFNRSQLKKCTALMQEPFPVLKILELEADEGITFVIPDAFLGGSAPLLQWTSLRGIRFQNPPKLLASSRDLVYLDLEDIPMTVEGHISPDAMTTCLSVLTKLQSLSITFLWQTLSPPYPTDQRPPSSTHTVLPALVKLRLG